jgi:hypothetical protein
MHLVYKCKLMVDLMAMIQPVTLDVRWRKFRKQVTLLVRGASFRRLAVVGLFVSAANPA